MLPDSAKKLLIKNNLKQYQHFLVNDAKTLLLPAVSAVPWIGAAARADFFEKTICKYSEHQVNFISKNEEPYSFQWQTSPENLKKAVRWGIVSTQSLTGKVISTLGRYRVTAHERIAKGMVSNTQQFKIQLLDHYQQRCEALQELESLVNRDNSLATYQDAIGRYIQQLVDIRHNLETHFANTQLTELDPLAIRQLQQDISDEITNAESYRQQMTEKFSKDTQALRDYNRARGEYSVLSFVKERMLENLYQMQGINQDVTYSKKRRFALTRGSLNDCIEDARKELDDYSVDLRNAVRAEHHGLYSSQNGNVTYDFGQDNLTPARQRQVLLGISFIEGWDTLDCSDSKNPRIKNHLGSEPLTLITATNWQLHRNFGAAIKSAFYFVFNIFKGMLTYTHPWEEETWKNKKFHLVAKELREKAEPNEPLFLKPVKFLKAALHALVDCFKGIRNLGTELFHIPNDIFNDWNSSKSLKDVDAVIKDAEDKIASIIKEEERRLKQLLKDFPEPDSESKVVSELAKTDYHLTAGEQNDILTAMVRGLDGFATVFTHNIYGQDPVAGLIFTTAYAAGAAAIVCPSLASSLFGASYVNWFSNFSYSMGAGKFAAVLAGGSTQAQVFASGWDTVVHGPDSLGANVAVQVAEDPLTYASYFALAYTLGYVLVNGIHGHRIPGLSDILREDLGSTPEASYPFIGGKFAIGSYELFHHNPTENFHPVKINFNGTEHGNSKNLGESQQKTIKRLQMATWLSLHAETLPKLEADLLFMLGRHIDQLFTVEEASSLKKILYPEQEPSIAFQLFSIPLTYIPAVLRFAFAFFLSPLAWVLGNPSPLEPIKNAGRDLYSKITTDLNRILVAGSQFLHVCFKVISSPIKALIFTINMIVDRIAVLMDVPLAHSMHRTFAKTHTFFNDLGEWLYPVRATKSVIFANPAHTIKELEHSYISMLEELNASKKESEEKLKVTEIPHFSSPFASAIDGPFCADTNVLTTSM